MPLAASQLESPWAAGVFIALLVMLALHATDRLAAENWPQWRGPNGDGTTSDSAPTEWGPEKNVKWRVEMPERSNSTPVVWEGRIFISQPLTDSQQRTLMCLDRTSGAGAASLAAE